MLRNILLATIFAVTNVSAADKNTVVEDRLLTLSYGDVAMDFEESDADASGWRLNLSYEKGKKGGNVLHGFVIGYIEATGDIVTAVETSSYEITSVPLYYAPKMLFGKKAFKGFIKGAIGMHFSDYQRTGTLGSADTQDLGLYAGASLGAMFLFTEKVFINAEYEWAYLSNSYYRDDAVQSVMVGIGTKF